MAKKRLLSVLTLVIFILNILGLTLVGCTSTSASVESITLNTNGVTTTFEVGDQFTAAGLKVTANLSDGTTKDVPLKDCNISQPNMTVPGQKTITVTYQQKSATYTVQVREKNQKPPVEWEEDYTVDPDEGYAILPALKAYLDGGDRLGPTDLAPEISIGGMQYGDRIYFRLRSTKAATAHLIIDFDHSAHGGMPVDTLIKTTVNNNELKTDALFNAGAEGHAHANWICYQKTDLGEIELVEGQNTILLEFLGNGSNLKSLCLDFGGGEPEPPVVDPDPIEGETYVFEAEDAFLTNAMVEFKTGVDASGDMLVGDLGNEASTVTFTVYAEAAATVYIRVRFASSAYTRLGNVFGLFVNEESIDLSEISVAAGAGARWYEWTTAMIPEIELNAGLNKLVFTKGANLDKIEIISPVTLTKTAAGEAKYTFNGTNAAYSEGVAPEEEHDGWLSGITDGSIVSFTVISSADAKAKLSFLVDHQNTSKPDVRTVLSFRVNGEAYTSAARLGYCSGVCPDPWHHYIPCVIGEIDLNEGENTIAITFDKALSNFYGIMLSTTAELTAGVGKVEPPVVDPEAPKTYVFEAEDAFLESAMVEFKTGVDASGNMLVGDLGGEASTVTFTVYAEEAATVTLRIRFASGATKLGNVFDLFVNGESVDVSEIDVPAGAGARWYEWTMAIVENISLNEGVNKIVLKRGSNLDKIEILSTVALASMAEGETQYVFNGNDASFSKGVTHEEGHDGWLNNILSGATITFTIDSSAAAKAKLYFLIDHQNATKPDVKDVLDFNVNGSVIETAARLNYCSGVCPDSWHHYIPCMIGEIDLIEGENTIAITFLRDLSNLYGIKLITTAELTAIEVEPEPDPTPVPKLYTFEAEDAFLESAMVEYKTGVDASGNMLVGDLGGEASTVTFTVYAEEAATVTLRIRFASGATKLGNVFDLFVNGESVDVSEIDVPAGAGARWYEWTMAIVENISLNEGVNRIVLKRGSNLDKIEILSTVALASMAEGETQYVFNGNDASFSKGVTHEEGHDGWLNNILSGATITFTIDSSAAAKAKLYFLVDHQNATKPDVKDVLDFNVNGSVIETAARLGYCGGACPDSWHHYIPCMIGEIDLVKGENTIAITFLRDLSNLYGIKLITTAELTAIEVEPEPDPTPVSKLYTFEAEDAFLESAMVEFKTGVDASGNMLVGDLGGEASTVTFTVYAEEAATVTLRIRFASGATKLGNVFDLYVNGTAIDVSEIDVPAGAGVRWYEWTMAIVENISLKEGVNKIVLKRGSNLDKIEILSTVALASMAEGETKVTFNGNDATFSEGVGHEAGHDGWLNYISDGATVTFKFTSSVATTAKLYFLVDHQNATKPDVKDVLSFNVNGKTLESAARLGYCSGACPDTWHHYIPCMIGEIDLVEGENTITITFVKALSNYYGIMLSSIAELTAIQA